MARMTLGNGGEVVGRTELDPVIVTAASVTALPRCAGDVLVTGSHGGRYSALCAMEARVRAVVFHDAGVGLQQAGIAALPLLDRAGMAAATAAHRSCRIGDADDMLRRGTISHANDVARAIGVIPGLSIADAARVLRGAPLCEFSESPARVAHRHVLTPQGAARELVLVDSASLVDGDRDGGAVIVTGSHGATIGADPRLALKADGFAAAFNDAGSADGQTRLLVLERRQIAAATVTAESARIGDAVSTLGGIVSAANDRAVALGAKVGAPLAPAVFAWLDGATK